MIYKKPIYAIFIFILLLICTSAEADRIKEVQAKLLSKNYIKINKRNKDCYTYELKRFANSFWIVTISNTCMQPRWKEKHLINSKGEFIDINIENLHSVFLEEFPFELSKNERDSIIISFIQLHCEESIKVINSIEDIPYYVNGTLDSSVEKNINNQNRSNKYSSNIFIYQQIGGLVREYTFYFKQGNIYNRVKFAYHGHRIGDALILE